MDEFISVLSQERQKVQTPLSEEDLVRLEYLLSWATIVTVIGEIAQLPCA